MKKKVILFLVAFIILLTVTLFYFNTKQNHPKETEKQSEKQQEKILYNKKEVSFKKYRVNKQFYLEIPELFVEMSDEEVNKRYTNDFKPGLIFTNDKMDVELFVHATNDDITNEQVSTFLEKYKATLNGVQIIKEEMIKIDQHNIAKMHYIKQNENLEESHHILLFSLNDKAIMIDFKYPSNVQKDWDKISDYTLKSLKFI